MMLQADRKYANALLARIKQIPGVCRRADPAGLQQPTLNVNFDRSLAGLVGLSEKDAATAMLTTLAGSSQTSPTYWLNPKTGVSYPVSVQTPQRDIGTMAGLQNMPVTSGTGAGSQLLGGLSTTERHPPTRSPPITMSAPSSTSMRRRRDAILAVWRPTSAR